MVMQKGKTEDGGGASLKPSDAVEGGGLLDNVNVTWEEVRFQDWDYNGTQPKAPALKVTMRLEDGDLAEQYFSCGRIATEDYKIAGDGTRLDKASKTSRPLSKSSNFIILMQSLVTADFPEDKMGVDCTIFEEMECHMIRVKAAESKGMTPKAPRADGRVFDRMNFVVDKIIKFPWDKKAATKEKDAAGEEVAGKTTAAIITVLKKNPKGLDPKKLAGQVFNLTKSMPAAQLAVKTDFLTEGAIEGNWGFEDGVVTPA